MRVAVTSPYFDFFPELKAEFIDRYPDSKFPTSRHRMREDELIDYLRGYEAAVIGLDRFTEKVCAALPELEVVSLCSAGVPRARAVEEELPICYFRFGTIA